MTENLNLVKLLEENQEKYRSYARGAADQFNLKFEEIKGSNELVIKMLQGPWDSEFVVAPPRHTITFLDFKVSEGGE
jgi:hypothetical protein